jgi:hypothetical protein
LLGVSRVIVVWAHRLAGEPLAIDDLPVRKPRRQQGRADGEDEEQEQEAPSGIGPAKHRSVDRLLRLDDERFAQLAEPGVDPELADAGSRPSRLRSERTSAAAVVEPLPLELRRPMSSRWPRRWTCWASEKKASMKATTMAPSTSPSGSSGDRLERAPRTRRRSSVGAERRAGRARVVRGSPNVRGRAPS